MLSTISCLGAVTNFTDIGENDRMRWEIEPFLVVAATSSDLAQVSPRIEGQ